MSIGDNIRKARGNIKQSDLAEMLNVDVSTISRWENDKNVPHGEVLSRIARVLKTSTEFLLGDNDTESPQGKKHSYSDSKNISDAEVIYTGGTSNNMFAIEDKKAGRVYYIPNNEEGRALFLSIFTSGIKGTNTPIMSNTINGDNNNDNQLGIINTKRK